MKPGERSVYALAERLGMTVARLMREMPVAEYFKWIEYCRDDQVPNAPPAINLSDLSKAQLSGLFHD